MDCQCHRRTSMAFLTGRDPNLRWVDGARRCLFVAALAVVTSSAWSQNDDSDCQCRAPDGGMRNLGTVECVDIAGTRKMVRCEMSTNTPFWKDLDGVQGCPDA